MARRGYDAGTLKRDRLRVLHQLIVKEPGIPIDSLQAEMAWREGLAEKTVARYVETLVKLGLVVPYEMGFKATGKK